MKKQGITFHMKASLKSINPSTSDSSRAGSVILEGQDDLPADLVIMGTGVSPATDFLKESGFTLEKDGGIKVDENLRVEGYEGVYAVGDIAHYPQYPEGKQRRVEHWNVAGQQVGSRLQVTYTASARNALGACDTDVFSLGPICCSQYRQTQ